ncbi:hypothetical protein F511_15831 [Dorcoceras hygrometricum]|uniref:Uncharacterized protein n=1 Tax=Dorcoceras hygrometricum TaxID=472368 RepID=A0A2Z7D0U0_9LAMI|nr:hypothetical protein F511_15831 [Dorcoceras hygrometricum]
MTVRNHRWPSHPGKKQGNNNETMAAIAEMECQCVYAQLEQPAYNICTTIIHDNSSKERSKSRPAQNRPKYTVHRFYGNTTNLTANHRSHSWDSYAQPATNTLIQLNRELKTRLGTRSHHKFERLPERTTTRQKDSSFEISLQPTTVSKRAINRKIFKRGVQRYLECEKWWPETMLNSPEKLTVNSVLGFEATNNNREKISISMEI